MTLDTSLQYDEWKEKLEPLMEVLGGQLKKKALHTIEFTTEMRALAYIMIFNLYPMKNLTTLSVPRTVFHYNLFTHKEIDICDHIYHLFIKSIKKRIARLTLPFPSLAMSLVLRARVKTPIGLPVMQREDPISEQTIIQSKAHIPGPSTSVSQIPRDEDAEEWGNTSEEIDGFTSVLEDIPSHLPKHQQEHPIVLIFYLEELKRCIPCWLLTSTTPQGSSHIFKAKSLPSLLRFKTWWSQIRSLMHFRTFGHSGQKGGVD